MRTNIFRATRAKAAADVRILRELNELRGLDELLLLVSLSHFGAVEVASICERIQLGLGIVVRHRS